MDPRVYPKTAGVRVGYVSLPGAGMVLAGAGAVSLGLTRTVPVRNPRDDLSFVAHVLVSS
jgi:hypothetical protein